MCNWSTGLYINLTKSPFTYLNMTKKKKKIYFDKKHHLNLTENIMGLAHLQLKSLPFPPILIRMNDTCQVQNLTVKNKPR